MQPPLVCSVYSSVLSADWCGPSLVVSAALLPSVVGYCCCSFLSSVVGSCWCVPFFFSCWKQPLVLCYKVLVIVAFFYCWRVTVVLLRPWPLSCSFWLSLSYLVWGFCPQKVLCEGLSVSLLFVWGFDCGKSLWPYLFGGKKVSSSLGKRSNLYGESMTWTLPEHNYKWFCICCGGCDFFRGKV